MTTPTVLVLGIGNLVMGDDGVGVRVVQKLQREYSLPACVDVMDGGTLGLDILPRLEGIDRLILVDAVETGGKPGTCVRLAGDEIPLALETRVSAHQMGIKDLLAVSFLTGHIPQEMVLVGVQPANIGMSTDLSPKVEAMVDVLLANVLNELSAWGIGAEPA